MSSRKLRAHFENLRSSPAVHHITPERWSAACKRHPAMARRVDASFGWNGDILEDAMKEADILVGICTRLEGLPERAARLKWIHVMVAGVDQFFPLDWLPANVVLTNNRGAHGAKAEQFVRMALGMLHSRMPEMIANQHARRWQQLFTSSIVGKTALIIGLGDLGTGAARAARQLGLKVLGVRRRPGNCRAVDTVYAHTELDALLPGADFLILATPLTPETQHLLDRRRLALMKPTASVVNIARASILDCDALSEKLRRGELAGAVLDVVDPEPLPRSSPLWATPNLILTPHISCDDGDHYVDISLDLWFQNLERLIRNRSLKQRVSRRLGY